MLHIILNSLNTKVPWGSLAHRCVYANFTTRVQNLKLLSTEQILIIEIIQVLVQVLIEIILIQIQIIHVLKFWAINYTKLKISSIITAKKLDLYNLKLDNKNMFARNVAY